LVLLILACPVFAEKSLIKEVEVTRSLGVDYINISTTGNAKGQGLLLEDQLLIDFPDTEIAKNLKITQWKPKHIKNISAKQVNGTARITINFKGNIDYEVINIFGRNKTNVEIYDRVDYTAQLMAAWEKAMLKRKADVFKPIKYKPDLKTKDQSLKDKIIVIDPGHGGKDPGGFSLHGFPEKNLTLQTARKAAYLLKSAGATVYLTRNEDRTSSLRDIVNFANKIKADIFISIHYNVFYKSKISGIETYYYNKNSRRLALTMHQTLLRGLKRKDRGLRRAMFYTIHHTKMPAVLLEPLFISNAAEEKLARSPAFQKKIAQYIVKGVKTYFGSKLR